jgi:hypothetical protein
MGTRIDFGTNKLAPATYGDAQMRRRHVAQTACLLYRRLAVGCTFDSSKAPAISSARLCALFSAALLSMALTTNAAENILFNGHDLSGWRTPTGDWRTVRDVNLAAANDKHFSVVPGSGVMLNSATNQTVNLISEAEFGDCEAHIEFCVPKNSNSGVYLMGRYEVQVFDSWGVAELKSSDCGGIYASCSDPKPDYKGRPPAVNASEPPGQWQSFDITFHAPRFDASGKKIENAKFIKVVYNGKVIQENVEVPRPTCAARWLDEKPKGPLMVQGDHGPVAYRKIVVRPAAE